MLTRPTAAKLPNIEQALREARDYEEWATLAQSHDDLSGMEAWKSKEDSKLYDNVSIRERVNVLRDLKAQKDYVGLLFTLNEGIHGNQGGMGKADLFRHAKFGTKHLIEEYVDELVDALKLIANVSEDELDWHDKIDFFQRASHCFGRSALLLSSAGSLGHFHGGVAKTLFEHGLLPDVISGTSAGSLYAAILGTYSDEELTEFFKSPTMNPAQFGPVTTKREFKPEDSPNIIAALVPDMTFQEAYEKTGRKISISIAPLEEHQNSRLMNAITSPNVLVRSAVEASGAAPGVFPPVTLRAKNAYGEVQPYLPGRQWVDGYISDDLPAKRLSRLFGVNHHIVSQANLLTLGRQMREERMKLPTPMRNIMKTWTLEWYRMMDEQTRSFASAFPAMGKQIQTMYSVIAQDIPGDITIGLCHDFLKSMNMADLMSVLPDDAANELVLQGERATWPLLERIRLSSKISVVLNKILDDHGAHDVTAMYKKRPKVNQARTRKGTKAK